MAMSLPSRRLVLYRLGAGGYLEIEHRILSVHFDIGIYGTDKGGIFLGGKLHGSDPKR